MAQYSEPVISPGLLELVDFNKPVSRDFSLRMDDDFDCGKYCEECLRTMDGSSLLDYLTDPTTTTEPLQSSAYSGERSGPRPYNKPHPKKL